MTARPRCCGTISSTSRRTRGHAGRRSSTPSARSMKSSRRELPGRGRTAPIPISRRHSDSNRVMVSITPTTCRASSTPTKVGLSPNVPMFFFVGGSLTLLWGAILFFLRLQRDRTCTHRLTTQRDTRFPRLVFPEFRPSDGYRNATQRPPAGGLYPVGSAPGTALRAIGELNRQHSVHEGEDETLRCRQQTLTEAPVDEDPPFLDHITLFLADNLRDDLSASRVSQGALDEQGDTVGRRY